MKIVNKYVVLFLVMVMMAASVSAAELVLENKDPTTWVADTGDSLGGILEYNSGGPEFEYSFTGTVSQGGTTYALVYYIDSGATDPVNGKPWNLANSVKIATETSEEDGSLVISGSSNLGSLPSPEDYNANPDEGDSYCDFENGFDDYLHCSGAKIWVMPEADYNEIAWNPDDWLFETDLITYEFDDEGPEITNVYSDPQGSLTCEQSNVHVYATITDEHEIDLSSVKVNWKYDGNPTTYSTPLFPYDSENNIWRGVIDLNELGSYDGLIISYHVGAADVFGNSNWEPSGYTETYMYDCETPNAEFSCDPLIADEPQVVVCTSSSWDTVDEELDNFWTFEGGELIEGTLPTDEEIIIEYVQEGLYTISLTVTDDAGFSDTETKEDYIDIGDTDPIADFTYDGNLFEEGIVGFYDESESYDGIVSWSWTFGDDGVSTEQNPEHVYADNGAYEVTLTVYEADGDSDSMTQFVEIENVNPVAEANGDYSCNEGETITLIASGTDVAADQDTLVFAWDLDGEEGYEIEGQSVDYLCGNGDGNYEVNLKVTDKDGGSGYDGALVIVDNVPPVADANGPYETAVNWEVQLHGSASDVVDIGFTYEWDFDYDGEGFDIDAEGQNPWVDYEERGIYTVALRVHDGDDHSEIVTTTVTVYNYGIELDEGWNLISIPLVPEDSSVEEVLNGVSPEVVWAYQYDEETGENEWSYYHTPEIGDLAEIIPGYGYYFGMEGVDTLYNNGEKYYDVGGGQVPMPPQVTLTTGWNLIGHYGMNDVDKENEVQDLSGGILTDLASVTMLSEGASPVHYLYSGEGYWAFITGQDDLLYAPSEEDYAEGEC